jgi:aryl-alcohol dehydrogenase-like predicted oxidoreductase/predicted kinase/histidinol phosphatase-like enzyme
MIGLGCMRLSTSRDRDDERSVDVIRAALDAGFTLFDTADSYCLDETERGHNERLIGRALAEWGGDRSTITVATKGGVRRPRGQWIPDGRAKSLREACEASRQALRLETIDLYQLHTIDPKTPLATSVRALARLKEDGWIRDVGLCNVTVSQIREAQAIVPVSSVQVSLGPLDDENLRNGVAEYCRDNGIRLICYRPLGGERRKALARDVVLRTVADHHGATPYEIVLAWLLTFGERVIPLPGATKPETVASIVKSRSIRLSDDDRAALDSRFSGTLLRVPRSQRRPAVKRDAEVVVVMGMPGAGKTTVARELEAKGYERLNRDESGGTLADLVPRLDECLRAGKPRVVLDNTYPTRASRNEVIETAWRHGVGVRCIWMTTPVGQAQVNSIRRMIEAHGSLPTPEEIKERARGDTRYLLPDAQFRYERVLEPPTVEEGFEVVEPRAPRPRESGEGKRALVLDFDTLTRTPTLRDAVMRYRSEGWQVFVHAWRPQVARGETTAAFVEQGFAALLGSLGGGFDWAYCPHDAGPPVCWCRKPIPGQAIEFAIRRGVALERSIVVGSSDADRTLAERVGARFETSLE